MSSVHLTVWVDEQECLRQHQAGTAVEGIGRQLGVSQATFFNWDEEYAHMGLSESR